MRHFPRTGLAKSTTAALRGESLFGDAHNGLFLAAPRRTGKSTFLQCDLRPELERQGVLVVYVDLWSDQRRDPGDLIAEAISKAMNDAGPDSVTVAGALKIDVTKIGTHDGVTLKDALQAL